MSGELTVKLPTRIMGTMTLEGGRSQPSFFVLMSNFTHPGILYRFDFVKEIGQRSWSICWESRVKGLVSEDFLTEQVSPGVLIGSTIG